MAEETGKDVSRAELGELVAWAEARLPQLIEDVYATVRGRMDLYGDDDIVPSEDLRRSVARNLRFMLDALAEPSATHDLVVPAETGSRRARQGAPLPEVLRAYRISFAMLWDFLVEHARVRARPETLDALLDAASTIWQLSDEHALALTEAYRAATAELLLAQQRRRSALVEALFTGQLAPDAGPWEAGKLLGLPVDGKLVVVAAETNGLAEESMVGIEARLAEQGIVSAWQLAPTLQGGVVSLRDEQCDTVLGILRAAAGARTGVSSLYRSLADTPRALHLARVALAEIPPGRAEVRMFSASPLVALLARDPDEGRRLTEQVLGAVLDLPAQDRAALLDTLYAYLDNAGSTERIAEALHCHPNTVRYRLRKIHELTDLSLTDPRTLAELASAAQALRLHPRART